MYVELHAIQSFALPNLNRDDTGAPKTLTYGGVRRARISSQCLKRAMRKSPDFSAATQLPLA
jgi:CRISPR system Cascade subunit CasC